MMIAKQPSTVPANKSAAIPSPLTVASRMLTVASRIIFVLLCVGQIWKTNIHSFTYSPAALISTADSVSAKPISAAPITSPPITAPPITAPPVAPPAPVAPPLNLVQNIGASPESVSRATTTATATIDSDKSSNINSHRDASGTAAQRRTECINTARKIHHDVIGGIVLKFLAERGEDETGGRHLLMEPAYHRNLGDTLLTEGEKAFFININLPVQFCKMSEAWPLKNLTHCPIEFENKGGGKNLAFWQAGGNWGDIWPVEHHMRRDSLTPLLTNNFTIIAMPQSLKYFDEEKQEMEAKELNRIIALGLGFKDARELGKHLDISHSRVIFTWRENKSLELAKKIYPFVRNIVVPDIALTLGQFEPTQPMKDYAVDVLLLLRSDKESTIGSKRNNETVGELLLTAAGGRDISFRIVDWNDRMGIFGGTIFNITTATELLALGKVIICDRLHAAILSYLSGLHFIYFDNSYGKLTKTLSIAFSGKEECSLWERSTGLEDAIDKAIKYLDGRKAIAE